MTELEGVNIALQTVGEMTLTTASTIASVYEAKTALEILTETRKTILTEGFNCNTDYEWELTADASGYIAIAANILRVVSSDHTKDYIMKDNKLYDKENNTFKFDAGSIHKVNIVWLLDFDDIPHTIAYYIAVRASRIVYQRLIGATDIIRVLMDDEEKAKFKMIEHDVDTYNYSIFDQDVNRRAITRNRNPRGILG
jgi:uncharacterized radical SAM superfamily Fe-S cluster-containing enzyme